MKIPLVSITLATVTLILIAFFSGGLSLVLEGMDNTRATAVRIIPLLLLAFIVVGQLKKLLSVELVNRWMQKFSGVKGIAVCAVGGGFLPGHALVIYTFLAGLFQKGVPLHLLLSLVIGKRLYNFTRFPVEVGLIDPQVALLRYLITLPVPLLMGLLAYRIFPHTIITSLLDKEGDTGVSSDNGY